MNAPLPPIYRDSRRLLVHAEAMVRHFSRYHKYTVGTDLRRQAMHIMRGVHRACFDRDRVAEHVRHLVWLIDDYKLTLQLAMEVGAFTHGEKGLAHFNTFVSFLRSGVHRSHAPAWECSKRRSSVVFRAKSRRFRQRWSVAG